MSRKLLPVMLQQCAWVQRVLHPVARAIGPGDLAMLKDASSTNEPQHLKCFRG